MIRLETDLRSIQIALKTGETASYVYASYTRRCPIPKWTPHSPCDLVPYSLTLPTFINDVEWCVHSLFNKARNGLDPSWQPLRTNGSMVMSFKLPLLRRPVEVSRETA